MGDATHTAYLASYDSPDNSFLEPGAEALYVHTLILGLGFILD